VPLLLCVQAYSDGHGCFGTCSLQQDIRVFRLFRAPDADEELADVVSALRQSAREAEHTGP
jgi:hypothetical protein